MPAIPTSVPSQISAGSTAQWQVTLSDYSAADGYSLRYVLHDGTSKIQITSTAEGSAHLVTVPALTSADYAPGTYNYRVYAEKSGERYDVDEGVITVLPDFATSTTLDARSAAVLRLAAIEETIDALLSDKNTSYSTIAGTYTRQDLDKLFKIRDLLRAEVAAERARVDALNGINRRIIRTRFVN